MGNYIDRTADDRLEFRTILARLQNVRRKKSRFADKGKERRGKCMRHKFSVFRDAVKRYDRKKMAFVTVAIGAANIMLLFSINEAYKLGEVSMHTEVVAKCAESSEQEEAAPAENGIPSNSELAGDTLLGVASVTEHTTEKETLFTSSHLLKKPSSMVEQQQKIEEFSFMNTMEEQNEDALQIEEQQSQSDNGEIISLSKQDRAVLLRIVEAEATDEDVKGRMLVANVVLNRVNCTTEFPDNVTDVVFDTTGGVYQFSPIEDGRYWSVEISDKTEEAVHRVLCGEDESQGALYFMARKYADADNVVWFDSSLSYLFAYGQHEFFR